MKKCCCKNIFFLFLIILSFPKNYSQKINIDSLSQIKILDSSLNLIIEKWKNRKIYDTLTAEIINFTKDEDLTTLILDNLFKKIPTDFSRELSTVLTWNKSRRAIYIAYIVKAEVDNGGFNQFYFNSSKQFAAYMPESFLQIGAIDFYKLSNLANNYFINLNTNKSIIRDTSLSNFFKSYETDPYDKIDSTFYALNATERSIDKLAVLYIRSHVLDFVDK